MLSVKTEPEPASPAHLISIGVQTESDLLNPHPASSLVMDKNSPYHSQPSDRRGRGNRPDSTPDANTSSAQVNVAPAYSAAAAQSHTGQVPVWQPQLPPVPASASGNAEEVARALNTIQDAYPYLVQSMAYHQQAVFRDPNQLPPPVPAQLPSQPPWPLNQPSTSHGEPVPQYTPNFGQLGFMGDHYSPPGVLYPASQLSMPTVAAHGQSSFQGFSPQAQEGTPVDTDATAEEKRRRNTAASARFRVKKKTKAVNLERTVSNLSGRVDELEQEAADLRKENGWLKEIVVLKSGVSRGGLAGPSQPPSSEGDEGEDSEEGGDDK